MKKIVVLFFILFHTLLFSQAQFETKVSKTSLGINERLRVDFTMNFDGDNFTPPNFEAAGFRIVGGPSQMVSQSWVNGRSSFNKSYSYVLMPLKKGSLLLKQATIEFNNQVFKTSPVKVTVGNAVAEEKDPYNQNSRNQQQVQPPINAGKEGVHLVAEISNTTPYINEPITIVYKIYVSNRSAVAGWRESNKPKYENFWSQSENVDANKLQVQNGIFKGENYRYAILRKTVLYPQKSGKLVIEPLELDVEVEVPIGRPDFFGQQETVIQNKKVAAGSKTIAVKPLPEAGKPIDFKGAVGKYQFDVMPSKTTLKTGESLDLLVKVTGKGNLKLFDLPKPEVPSSLEMYDPVHSENVTTTIAGMTGSISDKYTIVPQEKGNYPIKPIRFFYFDLDSKSYKTLSSNEVMLNVVQGATIASSNKEKQINDVSHKKPSVFADNKDKTTLKSSNESPFLGSGLFYSLLFMPFLAIPFFILFKRRKEASDADYLGNKVKKSNALAKKYLSEAKLHLLNKEPFYIALEKSMHNFLKAKLQIETSEMSKEKITEILLSRNANSETVSAFINLTENCELARYAPSTNVSIQEDYDKAVEIIANLEKQIV